MSNRHDNTWPPLHRRPSRAGGGRPRNRKQRMLSVLEWFFLLAGLVAVNCYIWVNVSASIDQAYSQWAFDQTLLGSKPSLRGFLSNEFDLLFGASRSPQTGEEKAEQKAEQEKQTPWSQQLETGEMVGRLVIPRLDLSVMVREGANESTLSRAVGHIPGTELPGQMGNVGLAGHRDTFFRPLAKIKKSDHINLQTDHGTFRYVVTGTQIVSPRDVAVLKASAGKTLTLVTCYPFYYVGSAPKRFIVHATEEASNRQPQLQPGS